ncbi:hypothetical protein PV325_007400 [Microctonus aethiopoides]|nr:hypothetical protein PV326_007509 [Microctonus aethiopoides]KAK0089447.1 hypothetical protein PV325_007400 [Microctonus aethiopoides]
MATAKSDKKVFCYFGSWSVYRPGNGNFNITRDIDPSLCTHLVYTFVGLKNNEISILDPWADLSSDAGGHKNGYALFNALREKNPQLKTLIAIGGWNEGSRRYSYMAKNEEFREHFAANAADFVRKHGFNGMDFDWEYPAQRGGAPEDVQNYIELLKVLRIYFDEHNLMLTAAVAPTEVSASKSYRIPEIIKYLDYVNIMTYDFHVGIENKTDVHAPLYQGSEESQYYEGWNAEASIKYWLSQGCPKEKILMGVPLYGRSFTLCDPNVNHIGAPACGPGNAGSYSREPGMLGYNEICEMFKQQSWNEQYDEERHAPYAHNDFQWITYDNVRSIKKKTELIKKLNLGGAMVWSIETDDFSGICGEKYPLLNTLINGIRNRH